jgi:hypothetical protein
MLLGGVEISAPTGQDAQDIVRFDERVGVGGVLGQLQGALRVRTGAFGLPTTMRGQAPVGVEPRPLPRWSLLAKQAERRLKVARGLLPFAAAAIDVRKLALETGKCVWRIQRRGLAVGVQPCTPKHFVQRRQGAPQRPARPGLVVFRPQQRRQRVAAVALLGNSQVRQQRNRFAGIDVDWRAVVLNTRWAEQKQLQVRHTPSSSERADRG